MSLVFLKLRALLAKFLSDCNSSVGVATHDFEQLVLRVVREAALCPQVRLHAGERHMALEQSCRAPRGRLGLLLGPDGAGVLCHLR